MLIRSAHPFVAQLYQRTPVLKDIAASLQFSKDVDNITMLLERGHKTRLAVLEVDTEKGQHVWMLQGPAINYLEV